MSPDAGTGGRPAPVEALGQAINLVRGRLFPFRFERWVALGFVAFLDGCGRGGASGSFQFPGGPGGGGLPSDGDGAADLSPLWDWLGAHLVLVVAVVALALSLLVALTLLVVWIHSRGVFMYLDNVATGRWDVARPWREHRERAWSYFLWKLGVALVTLSVGLLLLIPVGWAIYSLVTAGLSFAAVGVLGMVVLSFLALVVGAALFSLLLRDFAAPLQWRLELPCGQALAVAWGLVKAHPGPFAGYLGLKIVYSFVFGIVALVAGCLTCCIGFLPVISHTLLQPLHYFERGWSLLLLRQAGHDLFPAEGLPPALAPSLSPER